MVPTFPASFGTVRPLEMRPEELAPISGGFVELVAQTNRYCWLVTHLNLHVNQLEILNKGCFQAIFGCLLFTRSFPEMEHTFFGRSGGEFPGAMEHLKR